MEGGEERIRRFSSLLPARPPFFASVPFVLFSLLLTWRPRLIMPALQANCRGFLVCSRVVPVAGFYEDSPPSACMGAAILL